ncbi:hypothetical protein Vretimale_8516 [Volvox reticuliferus]|uniref:Uncharacterized protein n=1 Tax=Volvox reticuliferus TaxID=1737510 RepID=A0A8J4GAX1_9CHLO|nr:hypothetical protein Vretifemale_11678 [Volvox reticuliferus]GIM03835.1 hypothetical protein Vretimale_8516 [Volvox reticuliferus]
MLPTSAALPTPAAGIASYREAGLRRDHATALRSSYDISSSPLCWTQSAFSADAASARAGAWAYVPTGMAPGAITWPALPNAAPSGALVNRPAAADNAPSGACGGTAALDPESEREAKDSGTECMDLGGTPCRSVRGGIRLNMSASAPPDADPGADRFVSINDWSKDWEAPADGQPSCVCPDLPAFAERSPSPSWNSSSVKISTPVGAPAGVPAAVDAAPGTKGAWFHARARSRFSLRLTPYGCSSRTFSTYIPVHILSDPVIIAPSRLGKLV